VGPVNIYGKKHKGHYSPWITWDVNIMRREVGHSTMPDYLSDCFNEKFMNFQQTAETFGLVEFPRTVTGSLAMETSTDSLVPISKQRIAEVA
jgi:hypothetical protein